MDSLSDNPDVQNCVRTIIKIGGENYYLIVGENWLDCTIPRENDPTRSELRMAVETICRRATEVMEGEKLKREAERCKLLTSAL